MRAALIAAAAAAACALAAPAARADGDPASDVLLYEKVFVPYSVKLPQASTKELKRVVAEAKRRGYTIRVALIASQYDLGSVGVFWRKPKRYAPFLGQELGLTGLYRDRLLVVMPNGYAVSRSGKLLTAETKALQGLPTPAAAGEDVAAAAIRAVKRLAARQGVRLSVTIPAMAAPKPGGGSGNRDRLKILGAALVLLLVAAALETARRLRGRTAGTDRG